MPLASPTPESAAAPWRDNQRGDLDLALAGPRPAWWWTGRPPQDCPGRQPEGTLTSLPLPDLAACSRQQALDYFDNTWTLTETLFSGLRGEEAFFRPPYHHLRHPMIFYYGHPPALYVNKLRVAGLIERPLNPYFERLFETGVDQDRNALAQHPGGSCLPSTGVPDGAPGDRNPSRPGGRSRPHHPESPLVGVVHGIRTRTDSPGNLLGADP